MPTRHETLYDHYVADLTAAKEYAEEWWTALLQAETGRAGSPNAGRFAVAARWPAGPASHPRVVEVFRRYWIACARLNLQVEADRTGPSGPAPEYEPHVVAPRAEPEGPAEWTAEMPVHPPVFVYEWLTDRDDELADFLAAYTYSPIGRYDEDEPG